MFNTSGFLALQLERCWEPVNTFLQLPYQHDTKYAVPWHWKDSCVLLIDQASTTLTLTSLIFLTFFLFSVLVPKFLWSLHQRRAIDERTFHVEDISGEGESDLYYIRDEHSGEEDLVADVLGGETLLFLSEKTTLEEDSLRVQQGAQCCLQEYSMDGEEEDDLEPSCFFMVGSLSEPEKVDVDLIDVPIEDMPTPTPTDFHSPLTSLLDGNDGVLVGDDDSYDDDSYADDADTKEDEQEGNDRLQDDNLQHSDFSVLQENRPPMRTELHSIQEEDEKSLLEHGVLFVIEPSQLDAKGGLQPKKVQTAEDNFPDSCTNGSTSKSSCEWRGSINFKDSETDGFFSSSSRRSSANWESYTVYRKYDEEMMFFDRISSQKLRETEALRSIKIQPRSISERIVSSFTTKKPHRYENPYEELEAAYVAQVCLAWEALNWNYDNFRRASANKRKEDPGCPARVAQQFQEFQVLLQRFIETEPYEYGRRPEVYARIRTYSPKLLQVPEYHDDDELKDQDLSSRIPSSKFIKIMEDVIRTFMNFLKGDKKTCWQVVKELVKKRRSSTIDLRFLNMIKKAQNKKKLRLKELMNSRRCLRKRKLREEEEVEVLMGLIDLKIVSRVLRMPSINEHQVHWCQEKLSRVSFWNGRVQRDSTPLFFPAQIQI